jgi:Uma2 family endonuclease
VVNLADHSIEVHREPATAGYLSIATHRRGDTLRLVSFPDVQVRVTDVLPPQR